MTAIPERPNLVWFVSEDCPPWFGCYGDVHARTPNLDGLARRGVTFGNAHTTAPVCAPARFALITGVASESNAPANHMRAVSHVPGWIRTYPEILRSLGYWCTNNARTDYNADIVEAEIWDHSAVDAHWRGRPAGAPFLSFFNIMATHESSVFPAEAGLGAISGSAHRTQSVDPAEIAIPRYLPDSSELRAEIAGYYDRIAAVDRFVGERLAELEQDGLLETTIIIHTSDHGGVAPRSKRYCYDEGLRVPLILAAPPAYASLFPAPGSRVDAAVSTIRIPPTLVALAGGEVPAHMQGESLAGARFDADTGLAFSQRGRMDERLDMTRTVRDARFRYVRNYMPHRPLGQHQAFAWMARGYQDWETRHRAGALDRQQETFWQTKPGTELYDTVNDPDEVHNLAGDPAHAEIERRLGDALREHMLAIVDNGFLAEGSPVEGYEPSRDEASYPLARVIEVADAVTRLDPAELPRFVAALTDTDATVRRWGAIGVLSLGPDGKPAAGELRRVLEHETDAAVVIPCAEALARHCAADAAAADDAVRRLVASIDPQEPWTSRLEALAALTALEPELQRPFRKAVALAAEDPQQYIHSAGRYLLEQLDGSYTPAARIFDVELNRRRPPAAAPGGGR